MAQQILLTHNLAPGDITAMSACVRDLALTYPGEYEVHVQTSCKTLWEGNPHIAKAHGNTQPAEMQKFKMDYGWAIKQADRNALHFLTAFHRDLSNKLHRHVPVLYPKGDLYLDTWHREHRPVDGRYWYIITGGKSDFTTKVWSA